MAGKSLAIFMFVLHPILCFQKFRFSLNHIIVVTRQTCGIKKITISQLTLNLMLLKKTQNYHIIAGQHGAQRLQFLQLAPQRPRPRVIRVGAPRPQILLLAAPRPQVIQLAAPRPQVLQLAAPRPQILRLAAPRPQVLQLAEQHPQILRLSAPRPQILQLAAPRPQVLKLTAPQPQILRLSAPRPQILQLAAPRPQVLQLAAPCPQILRLAAPRPQVLQLAAPRPQILRLSAPRPQILQLAVRCPQILRLAAPRSQVLQLAVQVPRPLVIQLAPHPRKEPGPDKDDENSSECKVNPNSSSIRRIERLKRIRNRLNVQNFRLRKKMKKLKMSLQECKGKMSEEAYDEISKQADCIPSHLLNVYHQNVKPGKHEYRYDEKIRVFTLSLYLKSPAAYRHVRKVFGKALPSQSTVRRWCSKTDCSPGFNDLAFRYLKNKVEEYKSKGTKLLISLAVDEISIRKGWQVVGNFILLYIFI